MIKLDRKEVKPQRVLLGLILFIMGWGLIISGVFVCLTIVGILSGLGLIVIGYVLAHILGLRMLLGTQKVSCPNCGLDTEALQGVRLHRCEHCNHPIGIEW